MKGTEMNTATTVTLITISSLSLIASGTTLITVWVGAKNMQAEIDKVKIKADVTVTKLKTALLDL